MATSPVKESARYDHLQVIRGIASLMVLVDHAGPLLIKGVTDYKSSVIAPFLVPEGFQWVWLFLVISGFLLTKAFVSGRFALTEAGIRQFYKNRFFRLIPLLWLLFFLWMVLYYTGLWPGKLPAFNASREISVALCLPWILYLPTVHPIASMNSPVWSVVLEIQLCLILPLLLMAIRNSWKKLLGLVILWFVGIAALAVSVALRGKPGVFYVIYASHFYNFGFFAFGMLLALLPNRNFGKSIPWVAVLAVTVAAMGITQWASFYDSNKTLAISPLVLGPVFLLLVARTDSEYQIRLPSSPVQLWGGGSPLKWLESVGVMSYSVYLFHKPFVYWLIEKGHMDAFVTNLAGYCAALLLIALAVVAAAVFLFFGIENQFRIRRKA